MQILNRVRVALRKTVPFSSPSRSRGGRIQYAPTIGYVRFFEIPMRSPDWVRVTLRNTDVIHRLGTCEGSKNSLVFIPFGAVCGAYAIRPYDRVRAILRNTDVIPQLGTCCPSKNCPVFVPFGAAGWGVCNTPLRMGTCDSSKYRCDSPTEYVWSFKKLSRFHPFRGRGVGRIQYAPTDGYVRSFEIPMPFPNWVRMALQKTVSFLSLSGPRGGAYSIRPYDRIRVILRNTDAIS